MAVRKIKCHNTKTAESNERNGSHASATICRAYPRRQGHSGFLDAPGERAFISWGPHWRFFHVSCILSDFTTSV